jgi:hypothetical protein
MVSTLAWDLKEEDFLVGGMIAIESGMRKTIEAISPVITKRERTLTKFSSKVLPNGNSHTEIER